MVASEPVGDGEVWSEIDPDQDRAGDMRRHLGGLLVVAAISPIGRLLTRLDATATQTPAIQDVICGEAVAAAFKMPASDGSTPVRFSPSTRMKSPATSGS